MKKTCALIVILCAAAAGFSQSLFKGNAMHDAVNSCNYENVRKLILKTSDKNLWAFFSKEYGRDEYGRTPVYNLLGCDNFEGVKILNALIVLNDIKKLGIKFDGVYDNDNATPFYTFAETGNLTMVKIFADKNFRQEMDGVLQKAQKDNYDVLLTPSLGKLSFNVNAQNRGGYSPADAAADRIKDGSFKNFREKYIDILNVISAAGGKTTASSPSEDFFVKAKDNKKYNEAVADVKTAGGQIGFK
ncbi:MAG: hypothetical protein LBI01_02895 [Elusimicrobium sp.]|jgi:hypothetical protein|nr:hypothetical protein [Elusimicrobium sp.]